jgi:hypothetical protein
MQVAFFSLFQERKHTDFLCRMKECMPSRSVFTDGVITALREHFSVEPTDTETVLSDDDEFVPWTKLLSQHDLEENTLSIKSSSWAMMAVSIFFFSFLLWNLKTIGGFIELGLNDVMLTEPHRLTQARRRNNCIHFIVFFRTQKQHWSKLPAQDFLGNIVKFAANGGSGL